MRSAQQFFVAKRYLLSGAIIFLGTLAMYDTENLIIVRYLRYLLRQKLGKIKAKLGKNKLC